MNAPRTTNLTLWLFSGALVMGTIAARTLVAEPSPEGAPKAPTLPQRHQVKPGQDPPAPAGAPEGPVSPAADQPARADALAPTEPRHLTAPTRAGNPTWTAVKLHRMNQMEIQAATIEREGGDSPRVKSFAASVARDHERAERQLTDYARQQKINLAGDADKGDTTSLTEEPDDVQMQATLNQLRKATGSVLDRAFLTSMITGHDQAIQVVRDARAAGQDGRLMSLLDGLLPVLQKHRRLAATLNTAVAGTSSVDPNRH